jgi:excisionase family DNA binding protein
MEVNKMPTVEETYFTVEEVAERLKVSHMTIYRWIKAGDLGAYKIGGEFRITERDIQRFLETRRFRAKGEGDA